MRNILLMFPRAGLPQYLRSMMTGNPAYQWVQASSDANVSNSDMSYKPASTGKRGRTQPNPPKAPFIRDGISRQARNKTDTRLKSLMTNDHMAYLRCKASPLEWGDILDSLDVFGPQGWLSEKAICRTLMDLWWPLRYESQTGCVYLPFLNIHEISTSISNREGGSCNPTGFEKGPFYNQYSSVIPHVSCRRVGFVLFRNMASIRTPNSPSTHAMENANHYFAVVFDYDSQRAYSYGACGLDRPGAECSVATESNWDRWYGPELWKDLAYHMGWEETLMPLNEIYVISKEWEQVSCPMPYDTTTI